MQQILIPTTNTQNSQKAVEAILNRSLLYNKDEKSLYVKYGDLLHPIGGVDDDNTTSTSNTLSSYKIDSTYAKIVDLNQVESDVIDVTEDLNTLMAGLSEEGSVKNEIFNQAADALYETVENTVEVNLAGDTDLSTDSTYASVVQALADNNITVSASDIVSCTSVKQDDSSYINTVKYKTTKNVTLRDKLEAIQTALTNITNTLSDYPMYEEETEEITFE